jgi:hypothetical protein
LVKVIGSSPSVIGGSIVVALGATAAAKAVELSMIPAAINARKSSNFISYFSKTGRLDGLGAPQYRTIWFIAHLSLLHL